MPKLLGIVSASIAMTVMCAAVLIAASPNTRQVVMDGEALCAITSSLPATLAAARADSETPDRSIDGEEEDGETHARVPGAPAVVARGCHIRLSHIDDFFIRPYLPPKVCTFIA